MTAFDLARVLDAARGTAAAANHAFVGTEHLLAAVLQDPEGAAARTLIEAGIATDGLAEELLTGLPVAASDAPMPPPMSRFAERAVAEAEKAGGDLLLVLLRAPRGRVASVMSRRGAKLPDLRKALEPAKPESPPRPP